MKTGLLALLLCFSAIVYAQEETMKELYKRLDEKINEKAGKNKHNVYPKISAAYSFGINIVPDVQKEIFKSPTYSSFDFRGGYQTTGRNLYDQLYRYPEWGVGYYGVSLDNDTVFGVPNALFAYVDIPFHKWNPNRKWRYSYSLAGGLSFNFRPNNPQTNPINLLIGSYNNVYIDFGFWANTQIGNTMDAKLGLSFVHFSNGASTLPNKGMNIIGGKAILQHHLVQERPEVHKRKEIPAWEKKHGFMVMQAVGKKELSEHGTEYFNATTALAYKFWGNYKGQWIAQADLFYDSSNNSGEEPRDMVPPEDRNNPANYFSVGLFAGYEAVYNRISFYSGWGVHVWRRYPYTKRSYQRFGVRYRLWDGFFVGAGLKARTFAADYIEWHVGYNIF